MAKIGKFKKVGEEYHGSIVTLSVQHSDVRVVPARLRATDERAPTHRVFAGEAEVGAGWQKQKENGERTISVKIDDPSFTGPIYPTLAMDEDHQWALFWSRPALGRAA